MINVKLRQHYKPMVVIKLLEIANLIVNYLIIKFIIQYFLIKLAKNLIFLLMLNLIDKNLITITQILILVNIYNKILMHQLILLTLKILLIYREHYQTIIIK